MVNTFINVPSHKKEIYKMYPYEDQALAEAEVTNTLRQPITEALTEHPDYWTVIIFVHDYNQVELGRKLTPQIAEELGDKCLIKSDRVFFIKNTDVPLGKIKLWKNYFTDKAIKREYNARSTQIAESQS